MFAKQYTAALVSAAFFSIAAQAATLNWQSTNTLAHPVQSLIPQAQDSGEVAAGQSVHIAVALKVRDKAQLDTLTQSILQGGSKHYLSKTEFLDRFSPTEAQAQTVVKHLQANGFRNIKVAPNRLLITADGSAATVKAGFQTSLHRYNINGRQAFANVANAQVPSQLADIVLAVHGLQNVHQFHTALRHPTPQAFKTASVSGHSPSDFPSIYNANSLPPASNTTVGIIAEGDLTQTLSDLQDFAGSAGYGTVATSVINSGTPSSDTSGTEEWNLDSQDILAAAGGAVQQMNFYVAPSMTNADITAAFNAAVSDGTAKVINVSLGECETSAQSDGMTASADQIFQAAVAQGQTFSVSTGDSGSYECGGRTARQSYPAVSPYVIAVGGTTLSTSGKTGYLSETTWNGGGGGPSYTESAPAWQTSAGVLTISKTKRGVPDVSFDADPNSGALVLVNGNTSQIGGTSLAAPLFTGFWARIESANGNNIHSPAPSIYKYFKANPSLYHDVTSGSNGAYSAAKGWDYTTGWGSLNIANLNAFIARTSGF
ncbi:S8/S53 family peptidase [Chromobacterium haemolyticum]|uniref:S8/S53 family peptidase n=1 Tax=Chromobacterium haemolyticum TaxID=394935 RepID=A0ABS3GHP8_9NEIS|nr:S53 family peptidase [Chromobacterium haemolyticum]MBK0413470.1 S8/S53 family peptidase [Chromobacterium haemolyticum]MBO0414572.1 S8/S53 family peptidase [Chromobacterium haemolyticum]MBO0497569.1 S8/S53 family peptidase [Chromobacterium haemolyticum]